MEDLATDGGSKLNFIEAIRQAEGKVADALVVFHYGIFPQSIASLAAVGVRLHGLATWWDVLAAAEEAGRLDAARHRRRARLPRESRGLVAAAWREGGELTPQLPGDPIFHL